MIEYIKQYGLQTLLAAISGGVLYILKHVQSDIKKDLKDKSIIKQGVVALLHNSLFRSCEDYLTRGEITTDELDNLEALYESYHSLGGNGTGTALYERCKNLKIKTK